MSAESRERLPAPIPTGTVTFVFTDIEGSTERWDRERTAMQAAVRRHDELMRAAIVDHAGYVFKTIGDAFCAAFSRPEDALTAMLEVQRALAAEDFDAVGGIRVRVAIHTGTADERDADYFGPAVNRVARLLGVGHGGQVLVSAATSDLVAGALPAGAALRDLGEHRLRDLARAEHVFQLVAPQLRADFPPLRSLDLHPNNLPRLLTSFVGREGEVAEIGALLASHALVTLTGSGGVGKTRTSLHVAATLLNRWNDGVWLIELAPLSSGKYIPRTVAQALGLALPARGNALENLARALQTKEALLIFDNCEHVLEAAAHVASTLLRKCPRITLLASSRQRLGIEGEEPYPLPSLDVSSSDGSGIRLFVERARTVNKRFEATGENAAIITAICRRLDGIPLAIELAASRTQMLTPHQLLERLDARFALLTGGSRDALPRQQTLLATIDWSHDLLDARQRALFRRLGIFANGFALEGAVAVGSGPELDERDVFEVLSSLLDRSLVHADPDGDRLRYRLLESTRVYASEKLAEAGERDAVAMRHLRYLRDRFGQLWAAVYRSGRVSDLTDALRAELEDVRAALAGALERSDLVAGAELTANLGRGLSFIGLDGEERLWGERFLPTIPDDRPALGAQLRFQLSSNFLEAGLNLRAMELATSAVALARASGDAETLGWALKESAGAAIDLGRLDAAEADLAEAQAIVGLSNFLQLRLLRLRALLSEARGEHDTAIGLFGEVIREARHRGDSVVEQRALRHVVQSHHQRGRTDDAVAIARETLATLRGGGDTEELARWLRLLALFLAAGDELPEAAAAAREATQIFALQGPESPTVTAALEVLALVFALEGTLARAATLAGYCKVAFEREPYQREFAGKQGHDRLIALLGELPDPHERERLLAHGAGLTPEAAVAFALDRSTADRRR